MTVTNDARERFYHERLAYYLDAGHDQAGARAQADAEWQQRQAVEQKGLALSAPASSLNAKTLAAYSKQIAPVIAGAIDKATAPLKQRIEHIEQRGIEYAGVYQKAQTYRRGVLVSHDDSLWAAVRDAQPGEAPGTSDSPWQLALKGRSR